MILIGSASLTTISPCETTSVYVNDFTLYTGAGRVNLLATTPSPIFCPASNMFAVLTGGITISLILCFTVNLTYNSPFILLSSSVSVDDSSGVKLITTSPCTSELAAPYVRVLSDFLTVLITFKF